MVNRRRTLKFRSCIFLFVLVLLALGDAILANQVGDSLSLRLCTERNSYLFGEDIDIVLILHNITERNLSVYPDPAYTTTWQVVDEADKVVSPYNVHWDTFPVKLIGLFPHDSMVVKCRICSRYGRGEKMLGDTKCISPGKHTYRGVYNRAYYSEPCTLMVAAPSGEEMRAYELLCKAYPRKFFPDKKEEAILALEQLCSQYTSSVYREQGFERLAFFYSNRKDFAKVREVVTQFAELYPNSRYAGRVLGHLEYEQPPSAYEGFLQNIIATKRGTRVAEAAKTLLEQKTGAIK
jgi:hypothetical protein